ncbi:MAG: hypothetical protein V9E81_16580 [Marmoricola sp.]
MRRAFGANDSGVACGKWGCWLLPRLYALDHHVERLAEDHAHAQVLA